MTQETNGLDPFNQARHYGYQVANYAMEPIRLYVWGILRAFVAPSFDTTSQKTQDVFCEAFRSSSQTGNLQEFKEKISQANFSSSSPYFKTKTQEIAFRVLLGAAVLAVPIIGTGALAIPVITRTIQLAFGCGVLGQILHAGIASFSKRTYTVIGEENISKEITTCTSIASWNIGLVSVFAPLNVGTWESVVSCHLVKTLLKNFGIDVAPSRIERQAEVIRKLNSDIICFQEFFDPLQAKALYNQVSDQYPHAYLDIGAHVWKGPSGLGVFSKAPLQNFQVYDFKTESQGINRCGNKKFVSFDVQIQGKKTRVYTAHLDYNQPETRKDQLKEIKSHMDLSGVEQCMILGDLNFDRMAPNAVDTAYFNENFIDHLPPNYTCSDILKFKHSGISEIELESIDYIASDKPLETKNPRVQIDLETLNLSDHLIVSVEF